MIFHAFSDCKNNKNLRVSQVSHGLSIYDSAAATEWNCDVTIGGGTFNCELGESNESVIT